MSRDGGAGTPGRGAAKMTIKCLLVYWKIGLSLSYRGPENLQRWLPKAGIGEIVKFGPLFLVDMDGEHFCDFFYLS